MIIPCYHGRPMKKLKEYPSIILFQDVKTGIKVSYTKQELGMNTKQIEQEELKQLNRKPHDKVKF